MPVEAKPLFRPDVLRPYVDQFQLPPHVEDLRPMLHDWAQTIQSGRADQLNETQLLPDFITHFFCNLLGYRGPVGSGETYIVEHRRKRGNLPAFPAKRRDESLNIRTENEHGWAEVG